MKHYRYYLLIIFFFIFSYLNAQNFGKNKVQQEKIDWSVIKSSHFDIYYVKGHDEFGKLALLISENAYYHLYQFFRHPLNNRIPIIVYSSKQEFQATNIIYPLLTEGIGGFTETLRNRVALPFDGSYKKFEEVLTHELVHAYVNDIEGTFFRNSLFRGVTTNLPFWFSEGLPEFLALKGKNTYNNQFIKDMVVNDQLRDIENIGGFFAYRLGEAMLVWISETYNERKVAEYFYNIRIYPDIDTATERTFGFDFTELQNRFRLAINRKYNNLIIDYKMPYETAERHTNARENFTYENIYPRFSPDGNDFVYFSSHKARTSILKGSAFKLFNDTVLMVGERTSRFEEFHFQRNNIAWSKAEPNIILFVSKTSFGDIIYFYNIYAKQVVNKLTFQQFDSIYEIDISPCGKYIAITAQKDNRCDLYIYDLSTKQLKNLTDDPFFTHSPRFSLDSSRIAFVSERISSQNEFTENNNVISEPNIFGRVYENIYYIDLNSDEIYQITDDNYNNFHPVWVADNKISFISEKSGIANIDIIDLDNRTRASVTDILTGIHSFDYSIENETLIFSVYYNNVYDIYSILKPYDEIKYYHYDIYKPVNFDDDFHDIFNTDRFRFYGNQLNNNKTSEITTHTETENNDENDIITDESHQRRRSNRMTEEQIREELTRYYTNSFSIDLRPDTLNYTTPIPQNYRPRFQVDNFWGGFSYSPSFGSVGMLQLGLSDLMGDHGIGIMMDFNGKFEDSNMVISYMFLPHRMDYGFALFNFVDSYSLVRRTPDIIYEIEVREYQTGVFFMKNYPLSRFLRIELEHMVYRYRLEQHFWEHTYFSSEKKGYFSDSDYFYVPQLGFTFDNALYGSTGPMAGSRLTSFARHSFSRDNNTFTTFYSDFRHYTLLSPRFAIANRMVFGISEGKNPERFSLVNSNGVRGFDDNSFRGNRMLMSSLELRFPFIDYLRLGFPLPITISNLRGSLFMDIGTVWKDETFRGLRDGRLNDIKMGYGFGPRLNLGFFVLKFDIAWTSDFENHSKPSFYLIISEDF